MNRIYQGRVTKVEIPGGKDEQGNLLDLDVLWQHHELFQDAVNYYLVCLLSLATDPESEMAKLCGRITKDGSETYIWGPFRKRGVTRQGMQKSVAQFLTPGNDTPTFEQAAAAVLAGNTIAATTEGRAALAAGLRQLLSKCTGGSGCRNAAPEFLPRFCKPDFGGNYVEDKAAIARQADKLRLPFVLHDPVTRPDSTSLDSFHVHSIALPNPKKPEFKEAEAIGKLREMISAWRHRQPDSAADWTRLEGKITKLPESVVIPGYASASAKGIIKFRLYAMFFFRYVEQSDFTFQLLRSTTPAPKAGEKPPAEESNRTESAGDPIRLARGTRGYVFRAFTSLPCWGGNESGKLRWEKFDVAAFEEALKALHQVEEKGKERKKELERMKNRWEYQRQADFEKKTPIAKKWKSEGRTEEDSRPPVLAGDERIARLEHLVDVELRAEYEMSEGVEVKYGLQQRTIRGFRELQKIWIKELDSAEIYSDEARERLMAKLREYQKDNSQIVGSVRLFTELLKEPNWIIWREPTTAQKEEWRKKAKLPDDAAFTNDPLQALTDERELKAEISRLAEPIRLTPADPQHSRRQFYFSDAANFTERGEYRHEPNQRSVTVPVAMRENGVFRQTPVRLCYSAPRLLREGLRADEKENLGAMPWLQPMMAALGLPEPMPQDFRDCPVALMPDFAASGEKRILLNFPLTLETDALVKQLGKAARWDNYQFGGADGESYWLRWPSTWAAKAKSKPWWESGESFRCLSVDLGQRDAGAFAVLEASAGNAPKPQSRKLGEAGGKTWWSTVRAIGMLRLPGEDAQVLRDGRLQEEFSGERGRLATADEWNEAREICEKLIGDTKILGDDPKRYSFPELNDQLLFVLRRAQGRLARLQSWSCIAADEKRRASIAEQIREADDDPLELKPLEKKQAWELIAAKLIVELEKDRAAIQRELVRIADRIQPLRGRRWEWVLRPNDSKNYFLRQTNRGTDDRKKLLAGQRGLSIERIEQLESLRQRCQSLNRALQHKPGEKSIHGKQRRGEELPDPCPELLDRLEKLKDQRVNQTAHLILAQALGVRLRSHKQSANIREHHDIHGEYEKFREPVDFLVLENLDRYLASQGRSRGENSRLMKWCHRAILGKLKQLCEQPYGLRVIETPAAYSSRFCSLTSVAGFRAVELTPEDATEFRWKKHIERLADPERAKKLSKDEREESQRVKALFDALEKLNTELLKNRPARPKWLTLLAPVAGGPIFIPMRGNPQQADINAAINLGLRAIAAPENGEIHVRLRSKREGDKFFVRAENLREKARWKTDKHEIKPTKGESLAGLLTENYPNFFADICSVANFDQAEVSGMKGFASGRGLWGTINQHDWQRVEEINRARICKFKRGDDNVPM
ncbi:MAG: type V CRISPR-associated protein Cas12b [Verrucomicrobiota bacterium]